MSLLFGTPFAGSSIWGYKIREDVKGHSNPEIMAIVPTIAQ